MTPAGYIDTYGARSNNPNYLVRPAINLDLSIIKPEKAEKTTAIIGENCPHNFLKVTEEIKGTCKEQAYKKEFCEACGYILETSGELDLTNHVDTVVKNKKEASLNEAGYTGDFCCVFCGTVIEKGNMIPKVEQTLDLRTYQVIFHPGSGKGKMKTLKLKEDQTCSLTANAFQKTGYTFRCWNTKKNGSGRTFLNKEKVKNMTTYDTITIYAQWKANAAKGIVKYKNKTTVKNLTAKKNATITLYAVWEKKS